jgi:hypothetical protein
MAVTIEDGVSLELMRAVPAPNGSPVFAAPAAMDVHLRWQIPDGFTPANLAVSIRPTLAGELIALADGKFSQLDMQQPLRGLLPFASQPQAPVDVIRLRLNEPLPAGADGIQIVLYRTDSGAVVDEVNLPLP